VRQGFDQLFYAQFGQSPRRRIQDAASGEYRSKNFDTHTNVPLQLVLNNFQQQPGQPPKPQLKLMASMFQGMFPPIQVERVSSSAFSPQTTLT
jgi:ribosome biogenesis protein SSF1/2